MINLHFCSCCSRTQNLQGCHQLYPNPAATIPQIELAQKRRSLHLGKNSMNNGSNQTPYPTATSNSPKVRYLQQIQMRRFTLAEAMRKHVLRLQQKLLRSTHSSSSNSSSSNSNSNSNSSNNQSLILTTKATKRTKSKAPTPNSMGISSHHHCSDSSNGSSSSNSSSSSSKIKQTRICSLPKRSKPPRTGQRRNNSARKSTTTQLNHSIKISPSRQVPNPVSMLSSITITSPFHHTTLEVPAPKQQPRHKRASSQIGQGPSEWVRIN